MVSNVDTSTTVHWHPTMLPPTMPRGIAHQRSLSRERTPPAPPPAIPPKIDPSKQELSSTLPPTSG